jgi:hypothetical protein
MKVISLILMLIALPLAAQQEGATSSGGGSSVSVEGKRQLLDIYLHQGRPLLPIPGSKLPKTEALKKIGIERLDPNKSPAFALARSWLASWRQNSPNVVAIIEESLDETPFFYVPLEFGFTDQTFHLPPGAKKDPVLKTLSTVAYYQAELGVLVSKPAFESLDLTNQAALLVHEAVRHIQITYGAKLSNELLQNLTATLALTQPSRLSILELPLAARSQDCANCTPPPPAQPLARSVSDLRKIKDAALQSRLEGVNQAIDQANRGMWGREAESAKATIRRLMDGIETTGPAR